MVGFAIVPCLFLDTYEKGKQDILDEQNMDLSEDENEKKKEEDEDVEDKPLLPPEVFKHLKTTAAVEKNEEKPVIGIDNLIRNSLGQCTLFCKTSFYNFCSNSSFSVLFFSL